MPWAAAFAFGAIISPPDAVAATAILSRLNIPRRIVTILEGESLVNDASGPGALQVRRRRGAHRRLLAGRGEPAVRAACRSAACWSASAWPSVFIAIHRRLGDPFIEVLTALVIPYTAYIAAESLHVSGVLAVVAAGTGARALRARDRLGRDAHHGALGVEHPGVHAQQPGLHADRHPALRHAGPLGRYSLSALSAGAWRSARWRSWCASPGCFRCLSAALAERPPARAGRSRAASASWDHQLVRHARHRLAGGGPRAAGGAARRRRLSRTAT
jgi:hypothetical protein